MIIGVCTLEFHLPACRSLKEKRKFLNSLRGRIAARHNAAVAEVDYNDLWQRSLVGVVSIANAREPLDRMFQQVLREAERQSAAQLISVDIEFF